MRYQVAPGKWVDTGPQQAPERLRGVVTGVTVASAAAIPPDIAGSYRYSGATGGTFNPSLRGIPKVTCKRGHPLHGPNVRISKGIRHCRACHRIRVAKHLGRAA